MALAAGTRFGPYEVTGLIGAGGMGEVYRATDTQLGREVAIKTLPAALAQDRDRLARFEREAKLLATLNHPHIAAVYSLDRHEGTLYLAMELVDGETLEHKLKAGALTVEETLPLALQIAGALEAAHEKGVVHRDLKPANVMLTRNGQVKVLDFGLAKAFSGDPTEASPGHSPALSLAMTQQGIILGTAGYMSPEQASGQATDQRADIWAFGVVVYEMLTGLPLFSGESVPHILADVLKTEPDWNRLPRDLHPRLKLMLERCLTKKPRNRYHSIADARVDIERVLSDPGGSLGPLSLRSAPPGVSRARRILFAGAMIAIGAAVVGVGAWSMKQAPEPRQVVHVIETYPTGTVSAVSIDSSLAISPDGRQFVYRRALDGSLFIRSLDETEARIIPGTAGMFTASATFSPDGDSVAFISEGEIRRVPVAGGTAITVVKVTDPRGLDWTEDGTILYSSGREIRQVSENGGDSSIVVAVEDAQWAQRVQALPHGDWVLYIAPRAGANDLEESDLVIESPSSGERRVLRSAVTDARYVATGHIVYAYGGVLYAVPFDVDRLEITGGPAPLLEGVASNIIGLHLFDISDSGHLVYIAGPAASAPSQLRLAIADMTARPLPVAVSEAAYGHVRASPDGRWLAYDTRNPDEGAIVWIYQLEAPAAPRRLTFDGDNQYPVWSPDSERVAFQSDREGDAAIYVQRIDGVGGAERLTTPAEGETHVPESWSPAGGFLSFSVQRADTSTLHILSLEDGTTARFGNIESTEPIGSVFHPSGNWIAYHELRPGASQTNITSGVYVEPFPWTGTRYQAPKIVRDFQPFWSPDGNALRYIGATASGQLVSVDVATGPGLSFGTPTDIPFNLTAGRLSGSTRAFDVLPDGRFVGPISGAVLESGESGEGATGTRIGVVLNWTEELKRVVPTE